jgi:hypothetical protein
LILRTSGGQASQIAGMQVSDCAEEDMGSNKAGRVAITLAYFFAAEAPIFINHIELHKIK